MAKKPVVKKQGKTARTLIAKKSAGKKPLVQDGLAQALNWYNTIYDDHNIAFESVAAYLSSRGMDSTVDLIKTYKSDFQKRLTSTDWAISDLLLNTQPLESQVVTRWHSRLKEKIRLVVANQPVELPQPKPKSFEKRTGEKIAALEQYLDNAFEQIRSNKSRVNFNYKEFYMVNSLNPQMQDRICAYYKPILHDMVHGYNRKLNGYENINRQHLEAMIRLIRTVVGFRLYQEPKKKKTAKQTIYL